MGELQMLQDFVKGWMVEFVGRAWDVLENGITSSGATATREEQILFVTVLFQNLSDANNAALPHEITSLIESPPQSPWAYVAELTEAVYAEMDAEQAQAAVRKQQRQQNQGKYRNNNSIPWAMQQMMQQMMSGM